MRSGMGSAGCSGWCTRRHGDHGGVAIELPSLALLRVTKLGLCGLWLALQLSPFIRETL